MCRKLTFDPFRITGIVYDGVDDSIRFHAGLAASEKGKIGVRLIDRIEVFPLKILDQLDGQEIFSYAQIFLIKTPNNELTRLAG